MRLTFVDYYDTVYDNIEQVAEGVNTKDEFYLCERSGEYDAFCVEQGYVENANCLCRKVDKKVAMSYLKDELFGMDELFEELDYTYYVEVYNDELKEYADKKQKEYND